MTIQQAIEKAEEGGYKLTRKGKTYHSLSFDYVEGVERLNASIDYGNGHKGIDVIAWSEILLDPLFWQSLGRARGWHDKPCKVCDHYEGTVCSRKGSRDWKNEWHRFIDHLAEGKDAESFFETLQF